MSWECTELVGCPTGQSTSEGRAKHALTLEDLAVAAASALQGTKRSERTSVALRVALEPFLNGEDIDSPTMARIKVTNQPTNQPTDEPTNRQRPAGRSAGRSADHYLPPPLPLITNQPTNQPPDEICMKAPAKKAEGSRACGKKQPGT
jgi:hypothetical protein